MAIVPCGSTWVAQLGIRPQSILRCCATSKAPVVQFSFTSDARNLAAPSSSLFSQEALRLPLYAGSSQTSSHQRKKRFVVRADADYYSVLGVSKNASKSEIKSGFVGGHQSSCTAKRNF